MVDALHLFAETFDSAVRDGRPLAALSLGHPDPGAVSFAMLASVVAAKLDPQPEAVV